MSQPVRDGRDTARAIHAIREQLETAENEGRADLFVELMADDVVLMVPDQPVQEGKAACARFVQNVLAGLLSRFTRRISYTSAEVAVLNDAAFDRGTFSFTVSPRAGGTTTRVTGKYFWLLTRGDGGPWQVARVIMSLDEGEEAQEEEG